MNKQYILLADLPGLPKGSIFIAKDDGFIYCEFDNGIWTFPEEYAKKLKKWFKAFQQV